MQYRRTHIFRKTLSFGASDTNKSETIYYDGELKHLHVRIPNFANSVTAEVKLETTDGYVIWTSKTASGDLNKNINYNLLPNELLPCEEGIVLKITLSGAPGGTGGDIVIVGRYYGV